MTLINKLKKVIYRKTLEFYLKMSISCNLCLEVPILSKNVRQQSSKIFFIVNFFRWVFPFPLYECDFSCNNVHYPSGKIMSKVSKNVG